VNPASDVAAATAIAVVRPAAARLRQWAISQALPLWAEAGFDSEHGRFEERLSLDGKAIADAPLRLIVQARQIYSYSVAHRRGWYKGAHALVEEAYRSMVRDFRHRDGQPGWAFTIRRDGSVDDDRRDLYSQAFALLGIASYVAVSGSHDALSLADELLDYLDRHMRAPKAGGYLDALPATDSVRRQNPHMHMFEALLSLWSSSKKERYLERANTMFDLFTVHFFQPGPGVLGEYFDQALQPADGIIGRIVEPGHHYEWIWLLRWFERETRRQVQSYVDALYRHADAYGYDGYGLVVDELLSDGRVHKPSHRAWPVTEAIKANVVEAAMGRRAAADKAVALVDCLLERFFAGVRPGGWMDRLDERGRPATDFMPASTLYHVICALGELDQFVVRRTG